MTDPMAIYVSQAQGGVYKRGRMQREWFRAVQVGDVIRDPWGNDRVVRCVRRYENGDLSSLTFIKRIRGKFNRPGAIYLASDLRIGGWRPTGVRVTLGSEFDFMVEAEVKLLPSPILVTYDEARGIA